MKKLISLILCVSLILLVACQDEQADIYSAAMNVQEDGSQPSPESKSGGEDNGDGGLSGTLEISALLEDDLSGWWPLAQGFMELHPNVEVISNDNAVNYDMEGTEYAAGVEAYVENLRVSLASGDVPDLIFDAGSFIETAATSGLIYDLNEFMDSDPEYVREDYFETVIEAHEMEGKLYQYPRYFSYVVFRFRQDVMDELQIDVEELNGVDYRFLHDTLEKINKSGKFPEIKYIGREGREGQAFFYEDELAACINNETMEISFNTAEFIDYLNAGMAYEAGEENHGGFYVDGPENLFETDSHFVEGLFNQALNVTKINMPQNNVTQAVPLLTSKGSVFVTSETVAIPKNAKNPELAWEFIKYCIEESENINTHWEHIGKLNGDRFEGQIPINKGNFEVFFGEYLKGSSEETIEGYFESTYKALENEILVSLIDDELAQVIFTPLNDFYKGLMSAEECAKTMQERADIYMGENS